MYSHKPNHAYVMTSLLQNSTIKTKRHKTLLCFTCVCICLGRDFDNKDKLGHKIK